MKISDVLRFMGVEFSIRGDIDYIDSVKIEELNADWPNGEPSNAEFHAAAPLCREDFNNRQRIIEKEMSYPPTTNWLLALTKQIDLLSKNSSSGLTDEFSSLIDALNKIEAEYQLKLENL